MPVGELAVLLIAALSVALLLCVSHRARLRQAGVMLVCRRMSPDLSPMVFIAAMGAPSVSQPPTPEGLVLVFSVGDNQQCHITTKLASFFYTGSRQELLPTSRCEASAE